mmetsp:Transcript_82180/g.236144  ORF Transcript_82180/g.236144 Transcript_82180/m.236144 type:complete len:266 (-) Transcript_82180:173-970(-)
MVLAYEKEGQVGRVEEGEASNIEDHRSGVADVPPELERLQEHCDGGAPATEDQEVAQQTVVHHRIGPEFSQKAEVVDVVTVVLCDTVEHLHDDGVTVAVFGRMTERTLRHQVADGVVREEGAQHFKREEDEVRPELHSPAQVDRLEEKQAGEIQVLQDEVVGHAFRFVVVSLSLIVGLGQKGEGLASDNGLDEPDGWHHPKDGSVAASREVPGEVAPGRVDPQRQVDNPPQAMDPKPLSREDVDRRVREGDGRAKDVAERVDGRL